MAPSMDGTSSNRLPSGAIMYLINHTFLPPKLPQRDDFDPKYEKILLDTTIDGLLKFKDCITYDRKSILESVISMVTNLRTVHDWFGTEGTVNEVMLAKALENLSKRGGIIPLHIRAQNAGILISKVDESINAEAFELCPLNQAAISTKGRLRRSFPGPACSLSIDMFEKPEFQAMIAQMLAKMSHQDAGGTRPKVRKADQMHDEDRDTTHPKIITELFMGVLKSVGVPVAVSRLWKNTREEVLWLDSQLPWRRSPMWLLIRVSIQLVFSRSTALSMATEDLYKSFMVFLMSYISELSRQDSMPSDLVYMMNAKLARRLLKLNSSIGTPELSFIQNVMRSNQELLDTRWSKIVEQSGSRHDLFHLKFLDFGQDIFSTLPVLDEYIRSLTNRENNKSSAIFQPPSFLVKYHAEELPTNPNSSIGAYTAYNLRAFEDWVASNLRQWLKHQRSNTNTCDRLGDLLQSYHQIASNFYSDSPEATSIMLLTVIELWIACDESATHVCEILRDYDPGIPQEFIQSLVLPFKCQMERLLRVEDYLSRRRAHAIYRSPSIFRDFGSHSCFSVQYFTESPEHQILLEKIEVEAAQARDDKCNELRQKKDLYKSLMRRYDQSDCEYYEVVIDSYNDFREQHHKSGCKKCSYKSQASSLNIRAHEWPLPDNALEARSTVFELKVPGYFGHWRDVTVWLLLNVLKCEYLSIDKPRASYPLHSYQGLSAYFTSFSSTQRIGLLSENKPHGVTHRLTKSISITAESDVCLKNGLRYQYHDTATGAFVDDFRFRDEIPRLCIYKLPARSASLQQFLYRPATMPNGPPPNLVIASQSDCPDHMSLDEYKALSVIPLGYRIQWQNILLQLSAPSVDFKKLETGLVILQSIYQTGPSDKSSFLRAGHNIIGDEIFAHAFLGSLHEALKRIKENWESSQALGTFISLATRLLSLTLATEIRDSCLVYLASIRAVAFEWVNLLRDKAHRATNESHRADLISKAVEIALICIDSFNVDERYLDETLARPEVASVFIQCSIIIQEGNYTISTTSDPMIPILHRRWEWVSYRGISILAKQILEANSCCLDNAIKNSWSAYQAGDGWQAALDQFDHWLVRKAPKDDSDSLWVHFNLLTGELLVNGLPLARLPSKYECHSNYRTLFGHSPLEVMPSAVRGMQFSGKKEYAGYTLHFGIKPNPDIPDSSEQDLMVQGLKGGRKFELIPSRVLRGEFPVAFADQFVHWYDVTDDSLEFRSVKDPWTSSSENWRLRRAKTGSKWHMMKHGMSLVSVKSETAEKLSAILSPLENPLQMHNIFHDSSSLLEIELPRLQLGFKIKSGESTIQSRQFRGTAIDTDQSLGTLVGLHNKLMLKHESSGGRLVIIPIGEISCTENSGHVRVIIDKDSAFKTNAYFVDDQIGRLVDNGSLQSKLILCYLHALTSFCLPDPLIRRTGTEQALSILNSAAVRSFDRLAQENVEVLGRIADLTPGRSCYPANERVMQSVKWSSALSFLAQHGGFYKSVKSIFAQAEKVKLFYYETHIQPKSLDHVDVHLLERDCIRSSTFRVSGFGAEDHTIKHDNTYSARDRNQNPERGFRAFTMSSVIFHERKTLQYKIPFDLRGHLASFFSKALQPAVSSHQLQSFELMYDAGLLLSSSEFLSQHWITLHQILSQTRPRFDKFRLMAWISTLAFANNADMNIVQILASFFTVPEMAQISVSRISSFSLSQGIMVKKRELTDALRDALLPFWRCPEAVLPPYLGESNKKLRKRQECQFQQNQASALDRLTNALEAQWPCCIPTIPVSNGSVTFGTYVDMTKAMNVVEPKFQIWFNNYEYLGQISNTLRHIAVDPLKNSQYPLTIPAWNLQRKCGFVCIDDVFSCPAPVLSPLVTDNLTKLLSPSDGADKPIPRLAALIERLEAQARSTYEKSYVEDLRGSLRSLQDQQQEYNLQLMGDDAKEILLDHLNRCREHVEKTFNAIASAVMPEDEVEYPSATAAGVRQWPRLSPIFLLEQLARDRWPKISSDWKSCIVDYGLALTELQRAERLVNVSGSRADLIKELRNPGHLNWKPIEYPESLLLEVENGILIRDVQEEIAGQMRDPRTGRNAVMQLNMGEGKSSVIVPVVAAALADSSRLVRVIVGKPQSKQMFQMLVSKLGGLLGRRVYHMPFSRALRLGEAEANTIDSIYRECMNSGGVLLVQPEHILSFKLMGLEYLITGKETAGRCLLKTQGFFDTSSRDIVDESDENFSVKFELIYTMGMQRPIELSPERWICIHQVLDLVRMFAPSVEKEFPLSMEVNERLPGSFPRIRVLRSDAQERIFGRIAESICETGLNGFPIARQPEAVRHAVLRYVTEPDLTAYEIDQVEKQGPTGFWADTTSSTLLLLRGLIAGGVLHFVFGQKRWRVNYGLDTTRQPPTRLAVPYRAKDSPTPRSEFSHPDVVIVLTSLSYYYGGLDEDDQFLAFHHLLKSDHSDIEYQAWVKDAPNLPSAFHQLVGINLKDRFQCIEQVFPALRYSKSAIDYFLAHIVFPKEMKEFPHKLSASGWDIGQIKTHPTTGFSGTNDSRKTLPLTVEHLDLPEQKHTNALVLEYLLQPENSIALMPPRRDDASSDAELLLAMVVQMEPTARVILDVGAQILELSNLGVAREWLDMVSDDEQTQAVVFFNDCDELSVIDRKGHIESFQTSPFASQLDLCLVYLDEVHTRGTDLKLPAHYRAAVTLGPNLTKDRLVQACMRMRKLGKGQSVVFCVPEEIKTKMLERTPKPGSTSIDVSDVLSWAVSESCIDMRRSMPLWAVQGQRFEHQSMIWAEARTSGEIDMSKVQAESFLEVESQTLEDRYRPSSDTDVALSGQVSQSKNLNLIMERCREFNSLKFNSAKLHEEQERELSPEIEQERQVQKPAPAQPAAHHVHPDLIKFVSTGTLIKGSRAYEPSFETLRNTSAGTYLDVSQFPGDLLVTADFARTVQIVGDSYISDGYQRPVQWILTKTTGNTPSNDMVEQMIIISPYEAHELLPNVRKSKIVALHLYAPRPNLGYRALDELKLYTVSERPGTWSLPRRLILQLNIFSGQLYLSSFTEYIEVCEFLGLAWDKTAEGYVIAPDGFIIRDDTGRGAFRSGFSTSPVKFLKVLMTKIRRNCEGIDKTHMGTILDGGLLRWSDFGEQEDRF